jgi:ribA/ribD-fused uncharacterized protein
MAMRLTQFRDPNLAIPRGTDDLVTVIGFYPREFYPLDNFAAFAVDWLGHRFATSEHAYHWSKFTQSDPDVAERIFHARSPHEAQKLAVAYRDLRRGDWASVKLEIMEEILRLKLEQNSYVKQKLMQTLDLEIVEDSPKDKFWGWGADRSGRNELGKLWMKLRAELGQGNT